MATERHDTQILYNGMSIGNRATESITNVGYSNNGWIIANGFTPTRTIDPGAAGIGELRIILATLIRDLMG